ncbi:hypothetical protein HU200_038327 [Digitaria exilis]|uniref:Uncharacterized protein n=1 Tax=Digitaria exilis TaxID=1010633 RepID=A0A835ELV3_9POAL|nr:hypothetical protein HU200_038327 [Digitaria exilis]
MKITVQSSKVIKPAYGSRGAPRCPDDTDVVVPLTVFDKVNFDEHILAVSFFHPPSPPASALELGFAEALAAHRAWAGRLGGDRSTILLNDAGARLVEATADVALASLAPLEHPTPELRLALNPDLAGGEEEEEVMVVQVTRFACGSFAVGTAAHHLVSDGRGASAFLVAWGNATRGAAMDLAVPAPLRASVFPPRCPPRVEFEHRGAEFITTPLAAGEPRGLLLLHGVCRSSSHEDDDDESVVIRRVRFGREFIAKLKSAASSSSSPPYSTVQCVAAHIWRCATRARGIAGGEAVTTLRVAVDGRARMRGRRPGVPDGYTGNVVLWARATAAAGELVSKPVGHAAGLVSRAVSRVDDRYFRSFIDFASSGAVEAEGLTPAADPARKVHSPDMEVYSLVGISFNDLDFGTGRPFLRRLSHLPEGHVVIESSPSGDGGVDALVCLFSRAMNAFEACCYNLAMGDARL